jgi:hypothetical protein
MIDSGSISQRHEMLLSHLGERDRPISQPQEAWRRF